MQRFLPIIKPQNNAEKQALDTSSYLWNNLLSDKVDMCVALIAGKITDAVYEISDKMLTVENEIVSVMYVKDDF